MVRVASTTHMMFESVYNHIDGFLVGGVSLKLEFAEVRQSCHAYSEHVFRKHIVAYVGCLCDSVSCE